MAADVAPEPGGDPKEEDAGSFGSWTGPKHVLENVTRWTSERCKEKEIGTFFQYCLAFCETECEEDEMLVWMLKLVTFYVTKGLEESHLGSRDWGKLTLRDEWEVPIPDWGPRRELEDILRGEVKEDHLLEGEGGDESEEREGEVAVEEGGVVVVESEVLVEDVGPEMDIERCSEWKEVVRNWSEEVMEETDWKGKKLSDASVEKDEGERAEDRRGEDVMGKGYGLGKEEVNAANGRGFLSSDPLTKFCWGNLLPPPAVAGSYPPSPVWRPWEKDRVLESLAFGEEKVLEVRKGGEIRGKWEKWRRKGKRKSPAAAARSWQRLLKWQERLEPSLGPSRLQLQLRQAGATTPVGPQKAPKRQNLAARFGVELAEHCWRSKGVEEGVSSRSEVPGAQVTPIVCQGTLAGPSLDLGYGHQFGGYVGESWGAFGHGEGIMSASSSTNYPLLQHSPPTLAWSSILTPPPSPPQSGGWWVPEGTMLRCSACLIWGPLTPLV